MAKSFKATIAVVGDLNKLQEAILEQNQASTIVHGETFQVCFRARSPREIIKLDGNPTPWDISAIQGWAGDL